MAIRILADTNVILDYILKREPWYGYARKIVLACKQRAVIACIAAHSIPNIFYILRKTHSIQERKEILQDLCRLFEVEGIDRAKLISALDNMDFSDFEDCLQMECAKSFKANYIVSRNMDDFKYSVIPCISTEEMCRLLNNL